MILEKSAHENYLLTGLDNYIDRRIENNEEIEKLKDEIGSLKYNIRNLYQEIKELKKEETK
jgi:cell division protein FtsB|tara:strand:+ start:645 stop:827 length:183 start_codon:yes stop_codon:yes gene_type:complete